MDFNATLSKLAKLTATLPTSDHNGKMVTGKTWCKSVTVKSVVYFYLLIFYNKNTMYVLML